MSRVRRATSSPAHILPVVHPTLMIRWPSRQVAADVVVALAMTVLTVAGAYGESHPTQTMDLSVNPPAAPWPALLLVAVAGLVLAWRRTHPMPTLAVSLGAVLLYTGLGYVNGAALLDPVVALLAVAATARSPQLRWGVKTTGRAVLAGVLVLGLLMGFTAWFNPFGPLGGGISLIPGVVGAALFAGLAAANRRAYIDAMRQRAELAEQTREEVARRRVDDERLRIARELHDVVAHTMSVINVQAGVAAHLNPDLPEPVIGALAAIRDASKNGLRELRTILAVLHQVDEPTISAPAPDLSGLDVVVATACSAGLPTALTIQGQPRPLPAAVELAAYRIVQESLTNAIRHAGPATAVVNLDYGDDLLKVTIADTGSGAAHGAPTKGHGVSGMRARAAEVGGILEAVIAPGGGFQINAQLPIAPGS